MGIACVSTATATTSCTGHLSLCSSSSSSLWLVPHLTLLQNPLSRPMRLHRPFVTCQRHEFHRLDNTGEWRGSRAMIPLRRGESPINSNQANAFQKSGRWGTHNPSSAHAPHFLNPEQPPSRTYNYNWKLPQQPKEYGSALEASPSSSPMTVRPGKGWLKERDKINQMTATHRICSNFAARKKSIGPVFLSEARVDDSQIVGFQSQAQLRTSTVAEEDYISSTIQIPNAELLLHESDFVGYKFQTPDEVVETLPKEAIDEMPLEVVETLPKEAIDEVPLEVVETLLKEAIDVSTAESNPFEPRNEHQKNLLHVFNHVFVVDTISKARHVVRLLTTKYKDLVHACDTEVSNIDVKQETPVDHGELICFSVYSGPTADFGNGKSCIWVDVLDGESNILAEFVPFFEDASIKKVWHNYSFDCHILQNYNIKLSGFHADTIHLARLWDSSRRMDGGYSLEALSSDPRVVTSNKGDITVGKISMKDIFGKKKVKKDGSEGKIVTISPVDILQREERIPWICYSSLDSISTLKLFESLKLKLMDLQWEIDGQTKGTMYDFYEEYWRPFGNVLIEMEAAGILVDRNYLSEIEKVAVVEQQVAADKFKKWASKYCADAKHMNVGSDTQIRQLLFGGTTNVKNQDECLPTSKTFKVPNVDNVIEEGKKSPTKFRNITLHKIGDKMQAEIYTASGWPSVGADALKTFAGKVSADQICLSCDDYESEDSNDDADIEILSEKSLNKQSGLYGAAYAAFGKGRKGKEACHAIASLCEICSIDSLISNFILPLQGDCISGKDERIHCSLNINTETGRLSARRPNLQNPPALEKDRYKIRQAFIASPGNSLIVADYGQLELRILAHLAGCKSMLDAFKAGGDFHSRTAMNMYSYIREAVEQKEVLLEWYPQSGEDSPPVPLLKDKFASERRRAKMLNFSIAYGKTPVGLSKDWKVSVKEAKETVKLWYKERQEVRKWQESRKEEALKYGRVKTLLGRSRKFPSVKNLGNAQKGHIERAAINTPVQGSAADVAMCAMLQIVRNDRLKELGWKLLLQVHDEVILEGPSGSSEEAKAIVVECMSKPFYGHNVLSVDLAVDAKCAQSWYAAK